MIEKVADGIFRIEVPLPGNPLKVLNSYFIPAAPGGKNLLIDTGFNMPECRRALEGGISELGADLDNTDLYLTHMHSDHVGLAPHIYRPGMRVYLSEIDKALLESDPAARWAEYDRVYGAEGFSPEELKALAHENPARAFAPERIPELHPVGDGSRLHYGGMELEVILVPGHTPGNTVLYCRERKLMFTSDHVLFNITPNIISWPQLPNALGGYFDSLRKVRALEVDIPLPAHRGVIGTMAGRIDAILEHHRRRLEEAYGIVCVQPGLGSYKIASQMTWKIRTKSNDWADFPLGQKWFAVGEAMAHMEYLVCAGKVRKEIRADGHCAYFPE